MEPWRTKLTEGDVEAAWGQCIDRYRRLILVTIRGTVNHDERVIDLTIDWLRRQSGRPRARAPAGLTESQEQIFRHVFVEGCTHAETYELMGASVLGKLAFGAFRKELPRSIGPAADVARTLGWPNAKAVYHRVYRALTRLRATLAREGVAPEDLLSD